MGAARILVVDDEPAVLKLACRALELAGYETLPADGPTEALSIVESSKEHIHLVVSDVVMPDMRGPQLVREIQQASPSTAALLMSGAVDQGEIPPGLKLIRKPFLPKDLLSKVREVLALSGEARSELNQAVGGARVLRQEAAEIKSALRELRYKASANCQRAKELLESTDPKKPRI